MSGILPRSTWDAMRIEAERMTDRNTPHGLGPKQLMIVLLDLDARVSIGGPAPVDHSKNPMFAGKKPKAATKKVTPKKAK